MRDIFGIMLSMVKKKGKPRVHMMYPGDFTKYEIAAIGAITVQWAYLEHMMLISTVELVDKARRDLPDDATHNQLERRISTWKSVIKETTTGKKQARLLDLASRVAALQHYRNHITHGLWQWYQSEPVTLRSYSFREPYVFCHNYTFKRLARIADEIGEINYQLTYPPRQGLKKITLEYAHMNRRFLLAATGADLVALGVVEPKLPKWPPSQSETKG